MKTRVLFICVHNSARSQMAEALLNQMCGDEFEAHSAGLDPGTINPLVVEAMNEIGIDISQNKTKAVFDMYRSGMTFKYVVSVCDQSCERGPIFPGVATRLHWSFPDPTKFEGTEEQRLDRVRELRDAMTDRIQEWYNERSRAMAA
jgi:arsenate reductase (thioredoxin)